MRRLLVMLIYAITGGMLTMPMPVAAQSAPSPSNAAAAEKGKLRAYLDDDWKKWLAQLPELATTIGYPGHNREWTDDSPAGIEGRKKHLRDSLAELKTISRDALPEEERVNYDLYRALLETTEEGLHYGDDANPFSTVVPRNLWMPLNQMAGIQQHAPSTLANMPRRTVADYEDMLARLEALPRKVEQEVALLQDGLKRGYTPPKLMLRDVPKQIDGLIPATPLASPLLEPLNRFPEGFPEAERARLTARAGSIYNNSVLPAFQKLREYLVSAYIPACRESIAASALPNGAAAYAFHVRWETTTNLTPQQIHEIGLSEVQRIRREMDEVIAASGFKGSFSDFKEFLRTDPRFFYENAEDLVNGYRIITKKIDPELARLFGKLPRLPYGVCVIPEFKAPSQTTAYYETGSPAARRAGCYFVNTYNLRARPKWEMEALSLHEAVPGHHLQISLAQEQENVPEFRKHHGYSAFVEGWGLYAESLGGEIGSYQDPYSKFGQLSFEMWRAVRLVVDTGMHSMGWTRQQAIDYFRENTGKTDQDITVEVDRYIVWPGQALAYKLGQMKISELRAEAERRLGAKFDLSKFHDAVLEDGAVPLNVLEAHMKAWIAEQSAR